MSTTLEQQAAADLARAKQTADLLMGPIFKALGVKDAKALPRKPNPGIAAGWRARLQLLWALAS